MTKKMYKLVILLRSFASFWKNLKYYTGDLTNLRVKGSVDVNSPSVMTSSPQFPFRPLDKQI